jgi:hypothetical protein
VIQPSDTATAMINALLSLLYISSFVVIRLAYRKMDLQFEILLGSLKKPEENILRCLSATHLELGQSSGQ